MRDETPRVVGRRDEFKAPSLHHDGRYRRAERGREMRPVMEMRGATRQCLLGPGRALEFIICRASARLYGRVQ